MNDTPQTDPAQSGERLSFVVPVYNEAQTVEPLFEAIAAETACRGAWFEVLFVDDGSTDDTWPALEALARRRPEARPIRLARHYGKADALNVGFRQASGEVVFTLDGDLQDDPAEIPRFMEKLGEGYDLVCGWKVRRQDDAVKVGLSKLFNAVTGAVFALPLHDFNCGYKAYRRELVQNLNLYGELHRFIPVMAQSAGARIAEIPVTHHPRECGRSKYGSDRIWKGFLDLVTVALTTRFRKRPLHFFGSAALVLGAIGAAALVYLATLWCLGQRPIGNRPLLFFGILFVLLGAQLLSLGVVCELIVHYLGRDAAPVIRQAPGAREPAENGPAP